MATIFSPGKRDVPADVPTRWITVCYEVKTTVDSAIPAANVYTMYQRRNIMRAVVKKWGNSAAVRIPSAIMEATKLEMDAPVEVREEKGRIIIEPVSKNEYDLDRLLAGITAENIHEEVDFGKPAGKERF